MRIPSYQCFPFCCVCAELAYTDSEKMSSPREKLTCILNCITVITSILVYLMTLYQMLRMVKGSYFY